MTRHFLPVGSVVLGFAAAIAPVAAQTKSGHPPACAANELTMTFDGEQGNFNGMSHSGARLILRNIGTHVCTVPQKPQFSFQDAAGKILSLRMAVLPGMHPGPVTLPVAVPPEAEATGTLRWVSGDVYGSGICVQARTAILTVGKDKLQADINANVCGPAGAVPQYEQQSLHRDTVYTPGNAIDARKGATP